MVPRVGQELSCPQGFLLCRGRLLRSWPRAAVRLGMSSFLIYLLEYFCKENPPHPSCGDPDTHQA